MMHGGLMDIRISQYVLVDQRNLLCKFNFAQKHEVIATYVSSINFSVLKSKVSKNLYKFPTSAKTNVKFHPSKIRPDMFPIYSANLLTFVTIGVNTNKHLQITKYVILYKNHEAIAFIRG